MTRIVRHRVVSSTAVSFAALLAILAVFTPGVPPAAATTDSGDAPEPSALANGAIRPRDEADALHAVIAADRESYCRNFVAWWTSKGSSPDRIAGGEADAIWPLPSATLRRAAEAVQNQGAEFSYALRSLHPLDSRNAPQTDLEQRGLAAVAADPTHNYYGGETLGGRRYFTAIYPDLPAAAACVDCHHRKSPTLPRHRVGDILGGIVVRIPLEF